MMTTNSPGRNAGFDADEWDERFAAELASIEPPALTLEGRLHKGRILSFDQFAEYEVDLRRGAARELSEAELRALTRRYVAAVFPEPRWRAWAEALAILISIAGPLMFAPGAWFARAGLAVGVLAATLFVATRFPSVAVRVSRWPINKQARALQGFLIAQRPANAVWLEMQTGDKTTT
jgi:hypothetical protein